MSELKKTSIGGQALIEGIMMRGPEKTAMAVRRPDKELHLEVWDTPKGKWYSKILFVRGIFNMISTFILGYKCIMKSADIAGVEEEEPGKFEKWLAKLFGGNLEKAVMAVAAVLGIGLALVLFSVIPTAVASLIARFIDSRIVLAAVEGIIKIAVLVIYLFLCSRVPDMHRVFGYHGAEHKTIACYEAGEELTVENISKHTRFHPRCGTSFLLIVLIVSVFLMAVLSWENVILRIFLKLLMLPVIIGVAYEIIKFNGRFDNAFTRFLSAPGMWLQRITTCEPDASQIEAAIAAMKAVIPEKEGADKW